MKARAKPIVIGWAEYVDLPEWGIKRLLAKVDTGARSSALHVENVVELRRNQIRFDVVVHQSRRDRRVAVKAQILRRAGVRSSNGHTDTRYFVRTALRLGGVEREVEMSLVNRGKMIHRMLLGRTALAEPYVIDASRRMLQSAKTKSAKRLRKKKATGTVKKKRSRVPRAR